ncbi:MAG: hypothetical protein HYT76_00185 [Deltaproteobacteria bacterium]|nr:hypothetical protein [Deltaproteobacteria bacterium]
MMTHHKCFKLGVVLLTACLLSCDSGSGTSTTSEVVSDPSEFDDVDFVPADISLMNLIGTSTTTSTLEFEPAEIGSSSLMGCQAHQLLKEVERIGQQATLFQCYISNATALLPLAGIFLSLDEYTYVTLELKGEALNTKGYIGDDGKMKFRIKKGVATSKVGTLAVELCQNDTQTDAFFLQIDLSTGAVSLNLTHRYRHNLDDPALDDWTQVTGTVLIDPAQKGTNVFAKVESLANIIYALYQIKFDGTFGAGHMQFQYDNDGGPDEKANNFASGCFDGNFSGTDQFLTCMLSLFNSEEGSGKFAATGNFPGITFQNLPKFPGLIAAGEGTIYCPISGCNPVTQAQQDTCKTPTPAVSCFCLETKPVAEGCSFTADRTEHFTISSSEGTPTFTVANSSIFSSLVENFSMPTAVETLSKNFGDYAWDCKTPSKAASASIQTSSFDFNGTTCDKVYAKANFEESEQTSCFQDEGADLVSDIAKQLGL